MQIATIGLDIAKNVFQVHAADAAGAPASEEAPAPTSGSRVLREPAAVSRRA